MLGVTAKLTQLDRQIMHFRYFDPTRPDPRVDPTRDHPCSTVRYHSLHGSTALPADDALAAQFQFSRYTMSSVVAECYVVCEQVDANTR